MPYGLETGMGVEVRARGVLYYLVSLRYIIRSSRVYPSAKANFCSMTKIMWGGVDSRLRSTDKEAIGRRRSL